MKGFDALQKPKDTKIGKLIFNMKKPMKTKPIGSNASCGMNSNVYSTDDRNFATGNVLYYSFEDGEEESFGEDAVINIKPRTRILHSISEVSSSSDGSMESLSPPCTPLREFEHDSNKENCHSPLYLVEDEELELYLQPKYNQHFKLYNYACLDTSKFLNSLENIKYGKCSSPIPLHRRRLGSTPTPQRKDLVNICDCDKIKRSKSVGEISFAHARNSSSYNKFRKSSKSGKLSKFARYIMINGVEYKVPSNVPKYDPPDLNPPPLLPPKQGSIKHKSIETMNVSKLDQNEDMERKINEECEKIISAYPEDYENIIKDFPSSDQKECLDVLNCPTYVNDSSYLDTIRCKRRQRAESESSSCKERSGPLFASVPYDNIRRNEDNNVDRCRSQTLPLPKLNRKYDMPLVTPNSYTLKLNSSHKIKRQNTKTNDKDSQLNFTYYTIKDGQRSNEKNIYSIPDERKGSAPCKTITAGIPSDTYTYAFPAGRSLSDTSDYQYAYAHTKHIPHPTANRKKSIDSKQETIPLFQRRVQYTRNNLTDVSGKCANYENVKSLGTNVPVDDNNNENLLRVPSSLIEEMKLRFRNHEYTYISDNPVSEPDECMKATIDLAHSSTRVGSSYNMFQDKLDYLIPSGRFAKYVNVEGSDSEYKIPSNEPKFEAPELTPPNVLFKENSKVSYDKPLGLRFSNNVIDQIISRDNKK